MKTLFYTILVFFISFIGGIHNFARTQCSPTNAPIYESFNSGAIPQCWENLSSIVNTSPDNFWLFNVQGDYGAMNNGRTPGTFAKSDGSNPNPDSMMLISPEINLTPLSTPYMSFEWFSNNTDFPGDNNPLIIDVFDGSTWTNIDTLQGDSSSWRFQNYDLSLFMNQTVQIGFMVNQTLTTNHPIYNDILLDEFRIDNCISTNGQDGSISICQSNPLVDLDNNIIVKPNGGGTWHYPPNQSLITQNQYFNVGGLTPGSTHEVLYIERLVCYDTTIATVTINNYESAGNDGQADVCTEQPVLLFDYLSGNVTTGGTWYDPSGNQLNGSLVTASSIPGVFDYYYVVQNTNCDDDTATVEMLVTECSDWPNIGLERNIFDQISISPNPATTKLNITKPSNAASLKFEMLDMHGRVVLFENNILSNTEKATLSIDHLETGVYTLRVFNTSGYKTFKVVKQ